MKTLGIDTGTATCGWAIYENDSRKLVDLGAIVNEKAPKSGTLDYVQRAAANADVLAEKARGCDLLVVEKLSLGMPGAIGKLCVGLSWGVVLGLVALLSPRPRLLTIAPQRWQREVLPDSGKAVDYEELARVATTHIRGYHPLAAAALERIPERHRQHAIDAAMIAMCGGYRASRCDNVEASVPVLLGAACPHGNRRGAAFCSMCRGAPVRTVTTDALRHVVRVNGKAVRATDPGIDRKFAEVMKRAAKASHQRSRSRARAR